MSPASKAKWLFLLFVAFGMVLATGRSKVAQSKRIQASIESIYEDRLLVNDLILELTRSLHAKEIAYITEDAAFFEARDADVDAGMGRAIERFEGTVLTEEEDETLRRFKANVQTLQELEDALEVETASSSVYRDGSELAALVEALKADLGTLSVIQMTEGRRQRGIGDKAVGRMVLVSNVELGMLIVIALASLVVIFSPRG